MEDHTFNNISLLMLSAQWNCFIKCPPNTFVYNGVKVQTCIPQTTVYPTLQILTDFFCLPELNDHSLDSLSSLLSDDHLHNKLISFKS